MVKHFVRRINSQWALLDRLVATDNQEVTKAQYADRLQPLNVNRLKEAGVDLADGEIWDIQRLISNADWAVYDYIQEGIDAQSQLDRVKEEHARLLLHTKRLVRWLQQQCAVLMVVLVSPPLETSIPTNYYSSLECRPFLTSYTQIIDTF